MCNEQVQSFAASSSTWNCPTCKIKGNPLDSSLVDKSLVVCLLCDNKFFKGTKGLRIHWSRVHPGSHIPLDSHEQIISSSLDDSIHKTLALCKRNVKVMKRILKGARYFSAENLCHIIENCISVNSVECWHDFFLYPYIALRIPNKSDNNVTKSLVSTTKHNLLDFNYLFLITIKRKFS